MNLYSINKSFCSDSGINHKEGVYTKGKKQASDSQLGQQIMKRR